jgi:hypothetical protein
MKEIQLTQGKVALVDDEDFDYLNQWKWFAHKQKKTYYAGRNIFISNKFKTIHMHRVIMKTPDNMEVDHCDFNGLNCQKSNMRNCTHQQNSWNRKSFGSSQYLGVSLYTKEHNGIERKYIIAHFETNGVQKHLGHFKTEEEAALAYDAKAKEIYGEFANLNFK